MFDMRIQSSDMSIIQKCIAFARFKNAQRSKFTKFEGFW